RERGGCRAGRRAVHHGGGRGRAVGAHRSRPTAPGAATVRAPPRGWELDGTGRLDDGRDGGRGGAEVVLQAKGAGVLAAGNGPRDDLARALSTATEGSGGSHGASAMADVVREARCHPSASANARRKVDGPVRHRTGSSTPDGRQDLRAEAGQDRRRRKLKYHVAEV